MLLLAYSSFLALAELGATRVANIVANITELGPFIKPIPASLYLHPLPNPFPVPNTDITLDFIAQAGPPSPLPRNDVINCFTLAKEDLENLIDDQGDVAIAFYYEMIYEGVALELYSASIPPHCIFYSEGLSVLLGILFKMDREGYKYRRTCVLHTNGGDILGTAIVRRVVQ